MEPTPTTPDPAVHPPGDPDSPSACSPPGNHPPEMPVFAASGPPGARPASNPGESGSKPPEARRIDPGGISGYLAKIVPKSSLGMAVLRFRSEFPGVSDPSQLHPGKFSEWLESLPIAHV